VIDAADLAGAARALDLRHLLLAALGPGNRQAPGDEVVAAVAVLDLDHVAGRTQAGDLLREDELHLNAFQSGQRADEV